MTLDSEKQRLLLLSEIKNEALIQQIKTAKIVPPWVPEHPSSNTFNFENRASNGN